jgi:hypothetical protein
VVANNRLLALNDEPATVLDKRQATRK